VSSISLFLFLCFIPNLAHHNLVCTLAGHELASNKDVRKIGFTGSTSVGKALAATASGTVKVCVCVCVRVCVCAN